ncbi:MAG: VOC family protein [Actinomycetota bacterium]
MDIRFVAGFGPIVSDPAVSSAFYRDTLGLPLETVAGEYVAMEGFDGVKHLGVWPLAAAAESCFGRPSWPEDVPTPNATIEFELADADAVAAAAAELTEAGHQLIHQPRTEPWGQTIARLLDPDGLLVGLCHTPGLEPGA